jgi:hypothetical protein
MTDDHGGARACLADRNANAAAREESLEHNNVAQRHSHGAADKFGCGLMFLHKQTLPGACITPDGRDEE